MGAEIQVLLAGAIELAHGIRAAAVIPGCDRAAVNLLGGELVRLAGRNLFLA
jgi:hypothetical protein